MLGFDTLIFFLTLHKAVGVIRSDRRTLFDVLLRDGEQFHFLFYIYISLFCHLTNILYKERYILGVLQI
ncbi:hypothetical protein C8Q75DRAFT_761553 [Abortiporus biennis]|nr:hypothetical protein C8Q75DRAFT_761553 [Abortiporus biennis]